VDSKGWLSFLTEIADAADTIALRLFRSRDLHVDEKPDMSPVTEADLSIEETARQLVAERQPDLGVFGEEQGETVGQSQSRLIIDPIDATRNFVRGIPIFATLLAVELEGELVAGLVSAPALQTRWCAARGAGAFQNSERVKVSGVRTLTNAQLFHGSLAGAESPEDGPDLRSLAARTKRQRGFGDFYQHVLVAAGAGEISVDVGVSPWDIAPLQVLIEEAGGRATTLDGERSIYRGSLIGSNGFLHDEALQVLRGDAQP
jgi:histidinol-phosphatase